jgi:hypothetical protein
MMSICFYIFYTQIHHRSHSWVITGTSIKSGGIKLVLLPQTSCQRENALSIVPFNFALVIAKDATVSQLLSKNIY